MFKSIAKNMFCKIRYCNSNLVSGIYDLFSLNDFYDSVEDMQSSFSG